MKKNYSICVLDAFTSNPGDLSWDALRQFGELQVYERSPVDNIVDRAREADILLTNKVILDEDLIKKLPRLKYIGVLATGYNVVDIHAAKAYNIVVTNIPAYSTDSVAQMVFAHVLNIYNQVQYHAQEVKKGRWSGCRDFSFFDKPLMELRGKTMGIVGLGRIGMATARLALAFGMEVIALTSKTQNDLPAGMRPVSEEDLFRKSDVLSLHCPLTPENRGFVHKEKLALMKAGAVLVNLSRGPLVNEEDLAWALNNDKLYAAAVDVLSKEPPCPDNPLLTAKNCYITPHIAWATKEARARLIAQAVENVRAFVEGHPVNRIN